MSQNFPGAFDPRSVTNLEAPSQLGTFVQTQDRKRLELERAAERKQLELAFDEEMRRIQEAGYAVPTSEIGEKSWFNSFVALLEGADRELTNFSTGPVDGAQASIMNTLSDQAREYGPAVRDYLAQKQTLDQQESEITNNTQLTPEQREQAFLGLHEQRIKLDMARPPQHMFDELAKPVQVDRGKPQYMAHPFAGGQVNRGLTNELRGDTQLDALNRVASLQEKAKAIEAFFDKDLLVEGSYNPFYRNQLVDDLGETYDQYKDSLKTAIDVFKSGDRLEGIKQGTVVGAKLFVEALRNTSQHPTATLDYVLENTPQLLAGAAGVPGGLFLAMSNMGYAMDIYADGVEAYMKEHGGQLPPRSVAAEYLTEAAIAGVAEYAVDLQLVRALKPAKKGQTSLPKNNAAKIVNNPATRTAGRVGVAAVNEYITEGIQTGIEESTGKARDFSLERDGKHAYVGAAIGAASGGTIGAAGSVVNEATRPSRERIKELARQLGENQKLINTAKENGEEYRQIIDPQTPDFDPIKAVQALIGRNSLKDVTPEERTENLQRISAIVSDYSEQFELVDKRVIELQELENPTTEQRSELANLRQQQQKMSNEFDQLSALFDVVLASEAPSSEQTQEDIDEVAANGRNSTVAAQRIVRNAQLNPGSLSAEQAEQLAADGSNALSDSDRRYLQLFAKTQQLMGTTQETHRDIIQVLNYHRRNVVSATQGGNANNARNAMSRLQTYVQNKIDRANAFEEAYKPYREHREGNRTGRLVLTPEEQIAVGRVVDQYKQSDGSDYRFNVSNGFADVIDRMMQERDMAAALQEEMNHLVQGTGSTTVTPPPTTNPAGSVGSSNETTTTTTTETEQNTATDIPVAQHPENTQWSARVFGNHEIDVAHTLSQNVPIQTSNQGIQPTRGRQIQVTTRDDLPPLAIAEIPGTNGQKLRIVNSETGEILVRPESGGSRSSTALLERLSQRLDAGDFGASPSTTSNESTEQGTADNTTQPGAATGTGSTDSANETTTEQQSPPPPETPETEQAEENTFVEDNATEVAADESAQRDAEIQHVHDVLDSVDLDQDSDKATTQDAIDTVVRDIKEALEEGVNDHLSVDEIVETVLAEYAELGEQDIDSTDSQTDDITQEQEQLIVAAALVANALDENTQELVDTQGDYSFGSRIIEEAREDNKQNPVPTVVPENSSKSLLQIVFDNTNQIAKHFVLKALPEGLRSAPVLQKVDNFFRKLSREGQDWVADFIDNKEAGLTDKQRSILSLLDENHNGVIQLFNRVHREKERAFRFQDPMQWLLRTDGTYHPNTIAAFTVALTNYIGTQLKGTLFNDDGAIAAVFNAATNSALNINNESHVTPGMRDYGRFIGVTQSALTRELGLAVYGLLGIKARRTAPRNLEAILIQSLGNMALAILDAGGFIDRKQIERAEFIDALPEHLQKQAYQQGLQNQPPILMVRVKTRKVYDQKLDRQVTREIEEVTKQSEILKHSESFMARLFGMEKKHTTPELDKPKQVYSTMQRTSQKLSMFFKRILRTHQQRPHVIKKDVNTFFRLLGTNNQLAMSGYVFDYEDTQPVWFEKTNEGKNFQIVEQLEGYLDFVDLLQRENTGIETPFYYFHRAWKNMRIGMQGWLVNPQQNKMVRHLVAMKAWNDVLNPTLGDGNRGNEDFLLAVGESLGIKTDNDLTREEALAATQEKLAEPEIIEAVKYIQEVLYDFNRFEQLSEGEKSVVMGRVMDGVNAGKGSTYSLDGLVNYAKYKYAQDNNITEVEIDLFREIDGKNNGPFLGEMMFLPGPIPRLMKSLGKGGAWFDGITDRFSIWKKREGNNDAYEEIAETWNRILRQFVEERVEYADPRNQRGRILIQAITGMQSMQAIMGEMTIKTVDTEEGIGLEIVTKDGREDAKDPLMTTIYGRGAAATLRAIGQLGLDRIFTRLHDAVWAEPENGEQLSPLDLENYRKSKILELQTHVNNLLDDDHQIEFMSDGTSKSALKFMPSKAQEAQLRKMFGPGITQAQQSNPNQVLGYGAALVQAMDLHYGEFKKQTELANTAMRAVFEIYNAQLENEIRRRKKELVDAGQLVPGREDLSKADIDQISKGLRDSMPIIDTYFSLLSKNRNNGLLISKTANVRQNSDEYTVDSRYQKGSMKSSKGDRIKSHGVLRLQVSPGISALPVAIHSVDATIALLAMKEHGVLNVHDGFGTRARNAIKLGKLLNKITYHVLKNYSLPREILKTLNMSVNALQAYEGYEDIQEELNANILETMPADMRKKAGTSPLDFLLKELSKNNSNADIKRERIFSQLTALLQYVVERGAFKPKTKKAKNTDTGNNSTATQPGDRTKRNPKNTHSNVPNHLYGSTEANHNPMTREEPNLRVQDYLTETENPSVHRVLELVVEDIKAKPVNQQSKVNLVMLELAKQLLKIMPADVFNIVYVHPDLNPEKLKGVEPEDLAEAHAVYSTRTFTMHFKSPSFYHHGISNQTLVHEILHAATLYTLERIETMINTGKKVPSKLRQAYNDLELVQQAAKGFIAQTPGLEERQFGNALEDVAEVITWGFTDETFQTLLQKVLLKPQGGRRLMRGFRVFIDAVYRLLFGTKIDKKADITNAMHLMLESTGTLLEAAKKDLKHLNTMAHPHSVSFSKYQQQARYTPQMTAEQIFTGLGQLTGETQQRSAAHVNHLRKLLTELIGPVRGPFGARIYAARNGRNELDMFVEHLLANDRPLISAAGAYGFTLSRQEAYLVDQLEAVFISTLHGNSFAAKQLDKLYLEVRESLTWRDFLEDQSIDTSDPAHAADVLNAKEQYKYFFAPSIEPGQQTSQYLARFAAMGLAYQPFRDTLVQAQRRVANTHNRLNQINNQRSSAWLTKLNELASRLFGWLVDRVTKNDYSQNPSQQLQILVQNLAEIDTRKQGALESSLETLNDFSNQQISLMVESIRRRADQFANSDFMNRRLRPVGVLVSTFLNERVLEFGNNLQELGNRIHGARSGLRDDLWTEMKGNTADTMVAHDRLRESNLAVDRGRKEISNHVKRVLRAQFGSVLTKLNKISITKAGLKTDISALMLRHGYDQQRLIELLRDRTRIVQDINVLVARLNQIADVPITIENYQGNLKEFYLHSAMHLGYFMASGRVTSDHLLFNSANIARTAGVGGINLDNDVIRESERIIDQLASLYAMMYTARRYRLNLAELWSQELSQHGEDNGVAFTLHLHQQEKTKAKQELFDRNGVHFIKGYTRELINPMKSVSVAGVGTDNELMLLKRGFAAGKRVSRDPTDPNRAEVRMYVANDGGASTLLAGIISLTGMRHRGRNMYQLHQQADSRDQYMGSRHDIAQVRKAKRDGLARLFMPNQPLPHQIRGNKLAPTINLQGYISDYRYLMAERNKDKILDKNNEFDAVLGAMAGHTYDKTSTNEQNKITLQAMKDQFDAERATRTASYLKVSPLSSDPKVREMWHMLPEQAKKDAKAIFGDNFVMVRADLQNMFFGYRRWSISELWDKPEPDREWYNRVAIIAFESLMGEKAPAYLKNVEDVWQELIREVKDIWVIKNFFTLFGNVLSNFTVLWIMGVPIKDMFRWQKEAMSGALDYQKHRYQLYEVQQKLALTNPSQQERSELEQAEAVLKTKLHHNPVRPLMEAGVMQTIVEDVRLEDDTYSYKTKLKEKLEEKTQWVPQNVKTLGKWVYISHDTEFYHVLSQATVLSDFVARYALYKQLTKPGDNQVGHNEAIRKIVEIFVNYDLPTNRGIQYANDMGFLMFTKYYLRIQKVLAIMLRDHPARMLSLGLIDGMLDFPSVNDGNGLTNPEVLTTNRVYFPLESMIGAPDEIMTINAGLHLMGLGD